MLNRHKLIFAYKFYKTTLFICYEVGVQFTDSLTNGAAFELMYDTKISGNNIELGGFYG